MVRKRWNGGAIYTTGHNSLNDEEWEEPEPFFGMQEPPLPSREDMPPALWEMVNYAAEQSATNSAFSFTIALSAIAACFRGCVYAARSDGSMVNMVTIYTMNAALSGEGKSATRKFINSPLYDIEKGLMKNYSKRFVPWDVSRKAAIKLLNKIDSDMANEGRLELTPEEAERSVECSNVISNPPKKGLGIYSQTTPEAFVEKCEIDGFVYLATDEGSAIVEGFGRYSGQKGSDLCPFILAYDGGSVRAARRKNNDYGGDLKACLDISVQPSVLKKVMSDGELGSRGFINRFILMATPTTAGTIDYFHRPVRDMDLEQRWRTMLFSISGMVSGEDETKIQEDSPTITMLQLSRDADDMHSKYANSYQKRVSEGGDLESMKDLFNKRFPSLVLRIAALYHPLLGGQVYDSISSETMRYAIKTGDLVATHYISIVRRAGTPEKNIAYKVLRKLDGMEHVTVRELQQKQLGGVGNTADEVEQVLKTLESMGWAKKDDRKANSKKGGRPASPSYILHPRRQDFLKAMDKEPAMDKRQPLEGVKDFTCAGSLDRQGKMVK